MATDPVALYIVGQRARAPRTSQRSRARAPARRLTSRRRRVLRGRDGVITRLRADVYGIAGRSFGRVTFLVRGFAALMPVGVKVIWRVTASRCARCSRCVPCPWGAA